MPAFREGVNVLPARTEEIQGVRVLLVSDQLALAQFDEGVLNQQTERYSLAS